MYTYVFPLAYRHDGQKFTDDDVQCALRTLAHFLFLRSRDYNLELAEFSAQEDSENYCCPAIVAQTSSSLDNDRLQHAFDYDMRVVYPETFLCVEKYYKLPHDLREEGYEDAKAEIQSMNMPVVFKGGATLFIMGGEFDSEEKMLAKMAHFFENHLPGYQGFGEFIGFE